MIHAKIKDHEEQKRLADALKASRSRNWYRRLKIIQLSAAGYTVPQLIKLFDLSKATIHRYITYRSLFFDPNVNNTTTYCVVVTIGTQDESENMFSYRIKIAFFAIHHNMLYDPI
jgi:hypothetical protein